MGVSLGIVAATHVLRWRVTVISVVAVIAYATPRFWIGLMLIVLFSVTLGWLPTTGMQRLWPHSTKVGIESSTSFGTLSLPAVSLSLFYMALLHATDAGDRARAIRRMIELRVRHG